MRKISKRLLALFLVLALSVPLVPTAHAETDKALTEADYASADAVFAQIDAMEEAPAKKNASQTVKTDAAVAIVKRSDSYVTGSLDRNGNAFTWWTEEGIRCIYNPYMRQKRQEMVAPEDAQPSGIYNEPTATKGGWPMGQQVYLVGPYYGLDSNFSNQYKTEAQNIANAIGDTDGYTLYSGTAATVDKVAEAVSKGAVVIFDSHGSTDYVDDMDEYDYVTGANYSYLCLSTTYGLTEQDYEDGALYSYEGDAFINGAVIVNHMKSQSPAGIVWMAMCLGMATDTLCTPLRNMGVEVVYGYSQSVTFGGDYCWEEVFWDNLCAGRDVAASISAMKERYGLWDCSKEICDANYWDGAYTTIAAARADYAAFPIVVSDEDEHPGQRNKSGFYGADSLQTVYSTYTLFSQYAVTATSNNTAYGTVSVNGTTVTAKPAEGYFAQGYTVLSGTATVTQDGNRFYVYAQSDCQIQINFAAKTPVTVQFSGAEVDSQYGYAGDEMTLPTATAPEGYKFVGWTTAPLAQETSERPKVYLDSFTPTASVTLYALYSYVQEGTSTGTGDYMRVTEEPEDWSGEYLIVFEEYVLVFDGSLEKLDAVSNYQEVDMYDYTFPAEESDPYRFTVEATEGGYTIKSASGQYIGRASNANGLDSGTTAYINSISLAADGSATIVSGGAHLRFNNADGQHRFRYYKSSTYTNQYPVHLYKKDGTGGTVIYTSLMEADHEHSFTNYIYNEDATCTANGTETAKCDHCALTDTRIVEDSALGHDHKPTVTPPTCTEQGYTTHKCSRCQDTYVDTYVDELGHSFTSYISDNNATPLADGTKTAKCDREGCTATDTVSDVGSKLVLTGIAVTMKPNKLTYLEGENLDLTGMVVTAYYNNGTSGAVTDYSVSGYTSSVGTKTVTVTYQGKTDTFQVVVKSRAPASITSGTYTVKNSNISKITAGTSVTKLLSGLNEGTYCKVFKGNSQVSGNTLVGTGMAVKIMDGNKVVATYTLIVTGDTNGDGKITITDMLAAKAHVLQKTSLTGVYATAGDTNGDGKITITDFIQIKASILGKGTITPR